MSAIENHPDLNHVQEASYSCCNDEWNLSGKQPVEPRSSAENRDHSLPLYYLPCSH